mmetsp:Transcript_106065/g.265645  ORF Transcript_106065/g.265645 Transcript_106065/m.265645 type:complete len:321 (-) Transcript_106065:49-1011(-)
MHARRDATVLLPLSVPWLDQPLPCQQPPRPRRWQQQAQEGRRNLLMPVLRPWPSSGPRLGAASPHCGAAQQPGGGQGPCWFCAPQPGGLEAEPWHPPSRKARCSSLSIPCRLGAARQGLQQGLRTLQVLDDRRLSEQPPLQAAGAALVTKRPRSQPGRAWPVPRASAPAAAQHEVPQRLQAATSPAHHQAAQRRSRLHQPYHGRRLAGPGLRWDLAATSAGASPAALETTNGNASAVAAAVTGPLKQIATSTWRCGGKTWTATSTSTETSTETQNVSGSVKLIWRAGVGQGVVAANAWAEASPLVGTGQGSTRSSPLPLG